MGYHVIIKKQAEKQLAKLEPKTRLVIANWIKNNLENCNNPRTISSGKSLEGIKGGWRWRVGVYRILGVIDDKDIIIYISKIGNRKNVYQNLNL